MDFVLEQEQKESLDFVLALATQQRQQLSKPQVVLVGATLPPDAILDHYQQQVCPMPASLSVICIIRLLCT